MERFSFSLILVFLLCITMAHSSYAQNSPQDYLDGHNVARAEVGVEPMTWDDTIAAYAENYTKQRLGDCALQHSQNGPYGENIFAGSGIAYTAKDAVDAWVGEKAYYDYNSNTCATGQLCGHYTQVVWRNSVKLGCARVQCSNGGWFIICNYDPPGNYVGQRPYDNNSSYAQNSPQDYLDGHNTARAEVGVEPMTWDDTVAAYAQNYAKQRSGDCALQHLQNGPYGENIFTGSGIAYTAKDAVDAWVGEKVYYDYNSNTCAAGQLCGHYTQVVWRNSVKLGCAKVQCSNGGWFITCNYDPPGNYVGQRPYYSNSNSCPHQVERCGSYTQVVWHSSVSRGAAAVQCGTDNYIIVS